MDERPVSDEVRDVVLGAPLYTRDDASAAAGVPAERATALWRAMGFAEVTGDERVFTERDVTALRTAEALRVLGVVDEEGLLALTRSMAQALSRLAVSHASIAAPYLATVGPDVSDEAVSVAAQALLADVAALVEYVWRRHLAVAAESALTATGEEQEGVAVGFVDLVGFTELSRGLSAPELEELVERFEHLAAHAVGQAGGRVVKTLGDEVMFTVAEAPAGVSIALDLADAVAERLGREVRAGVAYGPVVARLGDVFGPTVNIASRLTGIARPGSVLADRGVAAVLRDDPRFDVSPLRRQSVRGYSHLAPFRVRRAVSPS